MRRSCQSSFVYLTPFRSPYRFETPWSTFEFAFHALDVGAHVVILSMAWLTREDAREFSQMPKEPDMDTLTYWVKRLEPLIRSEGDDEIIVIFANRTGVEGDAVYAGTSAVIGIKCGEVNVYGLLGRGEKELLVVDTKVPPFAQLVYRPEQDTVIRNDDDARSTVSSVQKTASVPGAEPTSQNAVPQSSPTSGTRTTRTHTSDDQSDFRSGGVSGSALDDLTPNTQAPGQPTTKTAPAPPTPTQESPSSANYSWNSAGPQYAPRIPYSPSSSTRSNHANSPIEPRKVPRHVIPKADNLPKAFSPSKVAAPVQQSPRPVASPKEVRSDQVSAQESTTRSLNSPNSSSHSKSQQSQRTNSKNIVRPSEQPLSKGAGYGERASPLPDLDKLGADMLIIEEGTGPKRDSLVCHPDEDDFVVSQPSKQRNQASTEKKEPHLAHKGSRHMRTKSVDTERRGSENRSSPHRVHIPKPDSPRDGRGLKHDPSQPGSRTSSRRAKRQSPEPPLPPIRKPDRTEPQTRDDKRSPRKEVHRPLAEQRPSPVVSSPHSSGNRFDWGRPRQERQQQPRQHLPISRFKTPGPDDTDEIVKMWIDQSNPSKRGAARGSGAADADAPTPRTVEVPEPPPSAVGPGGDLRTPKAMVLVPEADDGHESGGSLDAARVKAAEAEVAPLKCVIPARMDASRHEGPRSAVW